MNNGKWPLVPLGKLLDPISRPESVDPAKIYRVLGAHWYAQGLYTKESRRGAEIQASKIYRVEEGDFVYNRLFAWKGSFAVATRDNDGCYVSNEFPCFRVKANLLTLSYLSWHFSRERVWTEALGFSEGGTPTSRNRLKEEAFLQLKIPLPPQVEQQRVAGKLDALAAKIEEAKQLRRDSVAESDALFRAHANRLFVNLALRFPPRAFGEFQPHVTSGPRSWGGRTVDGGDRFYRAQDILGTGRLATLDLDKVFVEPPKSNQGTGAKLQVGDLMIVITGATVGRVGILPEQAEPGYVSQHVAICRFSEDQIDSRYAQRVLLSPFGQRQLLGQRYGQGKPGLNLTNIRNLRMPIPPVDEQRRVIAYLDHVQVSAEALSQDQRSTTGELDAMLPAILNRAFGGEP